MVTARDIPDLPEIDPYSTYGPAMRALTAKRRLFVMLIWERPGISLCDAARLAGYGGTQGGSTDPDKVSHVHRQIGHALMQDESVLRALNEVASKSLRATALPAVRMLQRILEDPKHKKHHWAIEMTLNRTGFASEQKITVERTDRTGEAMVERIKQLAALLGVDAGKLLGGNAVAADVKVIEHDGEPVRGGGAAAGLDAQGPGDPGRGPAGSGDD